MADGFGLINCILSFQMVVGILSRENIVTTVALSAAYAGRTLQILVESQGRINYNVMNDFKGLGPIKINGQSLENWTITGFSLDDVSQIEDLIRESIGNDINDHSNRLSSFSSEILNGGPIIYHATFDIDRDEIYDTYINTSGWGKVCLRTTSTCIGSTYDQIIRFSGYRFH